LVLGPLGGSVWSVPRFFLAYWFCMAAASAFLYGSVLAVQGFTALVLPRRIFLRLSAVLQLAAFGLLLFVYFLEPSISTHQALAAPENQKWLASSPSFWFLALFNWLNGSLPSQSNWLAWRACIGLTAALIGAAASLLLCYVRTMKKAVEEPDLVPGSHGWHWTPRFGSALQTAIILFSVRSLTRSRQHRVAFALFLALVFAIALLWLRGELAATAPEPVPVGFLISTFLMLCFAVFALRSIYALPISLTANWVLRTTQLRPSEDYIAATRRSMLLFSVIPICLLSSALSFNFRPFHQVAAHLAVLAVLGWILSELSLIGFYKVPFTCSYLPGKANIQFIFCGFFVAMIIVIIPGAAYESDALGNPFQYALMMAILAATACGLWVFNRYRSKSAVIYFEELPEELITTLRLISIPPPRGE